MTIASVYQIIIVPGTTSIDPQMVFPKSVQVFAVGPKAFINLLIELGVPTNVTSQAGPSILNLLPKHSIVAIDTDLYDPRLLPLDVLMASGDQLILYASNNSLVPILVKDTGYIWANEFHTTILSLPGFSLFSGPGMVIASGGPHFLSSSAIPFTKNALLAQILAWNTFLSDPPANADPCEYIANGGNTTNGYTFLTGPVEASNDIDGTFYYDMCIFAQSKIYQFCTNCNLYDIPITPMGYLEYEPSNAMINNNGYIQSMTGSLDYIASYDAYVNGYSNSYPVWGGGVSPSTTSGGQLSYTASFGFPFNTGFGVTYQPPTSPVSVSQTSPGLQGAPYPEANDTWLFTQSASEISQFYANGYTDIGYWLLNAGTQNQNAMNFNYEFDINLVTSTVPQRCDNLLFNKLMLVSGDWSLFYNPGGSWSDSGSYSAFTPLSTTYSISYQNIIC